MAPQTDNDGSIVKKAAEEQRQLDTQQTQTSEPSAIDPIYDPTTKTMKAPGMEGGFFVGGAPPARTPAAPRPEGQPQPQNIQDLQARMAALQNELASLQQQGQTSSSPSPPPVRDPPRTPMFGVDIPQQATTSSTAPKTPNNSSSQTPQQKQREPIKTPMFGPELTPPEQPQQQAPAASPQPQQVPAAPSQPAPPSQESPPTSVSQSPNMEDNPNVSPYGYISYSPSGQGFALIMDRLTQTDIDYFAFMANYLHESYPKAMPDAHPALMMKFAANHLLIDIRKALADKVICKQCHTEMPASSIQCPKCKAFNRCPQCHGFVGGSFLYI